MESHRIIAPPLLHFQISQDFIDTPLEELLDGSFSLKKIIEHPKIFRKISENNEKVVDFIVEHNKELLSAVFDKNDSDHSRAAYYLIQLENAKISKSFLETSELYKEWYEILETPDDEMIRDHTMLNRICYITQLVLADEDVFPPSCGYIIQFFSCINTISVISFFNDVLDPEIENYNGVQKWLLEMQFACVVANELNKLNPVESFYSNIETQTYMNLLKIVRLGGHTKILGESFHSEVIIQSVSRKLDNKCFAFAVDERYCTIVDLYNPSTAIMFRPIFEEVIALIKGSESDKIGRRTVVALILLTKMLLYDHVVKEVISEENIEVDLLHIIYERSNQSIIISSALLLASTYMSIDSISEQMVCAVVPPLIFEMNDASQDNVYIREIAFEVLDWCEKYMHENKHFQKLVYGIKNFKATINGPLKVHRKMIEPCDVSNVQH